MTKPDHVTGELLLRAMDDELPGAELDRVQSHLSHCEECRHHSQELRAASARVESLLAGFVVEDCRNERESLNRKLEERELSKTASQQNSERVLRRFGWGMAIAATVAIGIMLAPRQRIQTSGPAVRSAPQAAPAFEVDGESFVALPYSNPELPMSAPHIVEMQVPVSSLTDAGIVFEPVSNEASGQDRSVLADVLLGMDGQPLGVHVLGVQ